MRLYSVTSYAGDLRTAYETTEVTGVEDLDGNKVAVVKGADKDGKRRTRQFLDLSTGLTLTEEAMIAIPGVGSIPITLRYSEYKDLGGAAVPMKVVIENPASGKTVITYDKSETGLTIDPGVFVLKPAAK